MEAGWISAFSRDPHLWRPCRPRNLLQDREGGVEVALPVLGAVTPAREKPRRGRYQVGARPRSARTKSSIASMASAGRDQGAQRAQDVPKPEIVESGQSLNPWHRSVQSVLQSLPERPFDRIGRFIADHSADLRHDLRLFLPSIACALGLPPARNLLPIGGGSRSPILRAADCRVRNVLLRVWAAGRCEHLQLAPVPCSLLRDVLLSATQEIPHINRADAAPWSRSSTRWQRAARSW
jgi:hypothetical protein